MKEALDAIGISLMGLINRNASLSTEVRQHPTRGELQCLLRLHHHGAYALGSVIFKASDLYTISPVDVDQRIGREYARITYAIKTTAPSPLLGDDI